MTTGDFSSLVTAEVVSDHRTSIAAGTLFGNTAPRLVQKGTFRLESRLEGILLLTEHRDVPGVIGKVGEIFGRHRVNIAYLSVGRGTNEPGGEAIGVFALDAPPPAEALTEIVALEPVLRACVVKLPAASKLPVWLGGAPDR
jgi:D-3-phosphoglycerate dehydrogenase